MDDKNKGKLFLDNTDNVFVDNKNTIKTKKKTDEK